MGKGWNWFSQSVEWSNSETATEWKCAIAGHALCAWWGRDFAHFAPDVRLQLADPTSHTQYDVHMPVLSAQYVISAWTKRSVSQRYSCKCYDMFGSSPCQRLTLWEFASRHAQQ